MQATKPRQPSKFPKKLQDGNLTARRLAKASSANTIVKQFKPKKKPFKAEVTLSEDSSTKQAPADVGGNIKAFEAARSIQLGKP